MTVTGGTVAFILALSVRMRRREGETLYMIGGARRTVIRLMGAETVILVVTSLLLAAGLVAITLTGRDAFLRYLLQG